MTRTHPSSPVCRSSRQVHIHRVLNHINRGHCRLTVSGSSGFIASILSKLVRPFSVSNTAARVIVSRAPEHICFKYSATWEVV